MSNLRKYARNLAANWIGYFANLLVMFFLSPFVIHALGEAAYGVWTLLVSLTGYLGLVEMGTRAGLGRHITFYLGKGDIPKVNGFLNTAMLIFLAAGVVLLLAAGVLGTFFPVFFSKVPAELIHSAQMAIFLTALNLWLSFFSAAFTQILVAHERFDFSNAVNLGVLVIRTAGTVATLKMGGGIVELAAVQAASSIAGVVACWFLARRVLPSMRLDLRLASRSHFRELFGFSVWAFIGGAAMQLYYWTDTVIIAIFLGPSMVAFYSVASMLVMQSRGVVAECANVFGPQIIKDCARKDWHALGWLIQRASGVVMAVAIPVFVGLIFFGKEFIGLWMGGKFLVAYPVLAILSAAQLPALASMASGAVYSGLNKVRFGALLSIAGALASIVLMVVLLAGWQLGLAGVAWGVFFPRVAFAIIGIGFALKWIGLPARTYLARLGPRWIALCAAIAGACLATNFCVPATGWPWFFFKVAIIAALSAPVLYALALDGDQRLRLRAGIARLMPSPRTEP